MNTIEIEIEENLIPEGYEIKRLGTVQKGDLVLNDVGTVIEACSDYARHTSFGVILEKIRWRAKELDAYWYVDEQADAYETADRRYDEDNDRYELGNYYETMEQAEQAAERVVRAYLGE